MAGTTGKEGHDTAKVYRALFSPVAAGAAVGTTMWGTEHSADIRNVVVPERIRRPWSPHPATWRTAMIVAARERSQIHWSQLQKLDVLRRYFEQAMLQATGGLARIDTRLG
jgi:hypothetical protein